MADQDEQKTVAEEGVDEWGNPPQSEEVVESPKVEDAAPTSEAPVIDTSPITEAISKGMSDLKTELAETLKPKEPETLPEDEGWKPKDWSEFPELAEERAKKVYEEMRSQEKAEEDRVKSEAKAEEDRINAAFDGMVTDLEKDGLLPAIKDESNVDDPGRKSRAELYGYAASLGTLDLKAAGTQLKQLHDNGFSYDPKSQQLLRSNPRPRGLDAPVGTSSRTSAPGKQPLDFHNMSWDDLTRRAKEDYLTR